MTAEELLKRPPKTVKVRIEELDWDLQVRGMTGDEETRLYDSIDEKTEKPDAGVTKIIALSCCLAEDGRSPFFTDDQLKQFLKEQPGSAVDLMLEAVTRIRTDAEKDKKKSSETPPSEPA